MRRAWFIRFYLETIDTATGIPNPSFYSEQPKPGFTIRVAEKLYLRNDWNDTIFQRVSQKVHLPQPVNMCTVIMILYFWENS